MNRGPISELGVSERALAFAASLADMEDGPVPQQINFNPAPQAVSATPMLPNQLQYPPQYRQQQAPPPPVRAAPPPPPPDPLANMAPPQAMPQMSHMQAMMPPPSQQGMGDYPQQGPMGDYPQQVPMGDYPQQAPMGDYPQHVAAPGPPVYPSMSPQYPMSPGAQAQPAQAQVLLPGLRPSKQASPQVAQQLRAAAPAPPVENSAGNSAFPPAPANGDMQAKYSELENSLKAMENERSILVEEQKKLKAELAQLVQTSEQKAEDGIANDESNRQYTERLEAEKEDLNALGEVEQLAREKQLMEERLATTLEVSEQLVEEKEEMLKEQEELKESERKAVRGEILNQRYERKEAAAKFQELEEELKRERAEKQHVQEINTELSEKAGTIATLLDQKAVDMNEKAELQQQKDEALAKLNEQIAINADMEQQMIDYQKQVMELQAAKVDDDRRAQMGRDEVQDQKDNLERKVLELSALSQEKVALASSLLEEKLQTQQELHDLKTELDSRLDTIEGLKRESVGERERFDEERRVLEDEVARLGEEKALKAMELSDAIKARQTMQAILEDEKIKVQRELEQAQYDREQARRERETEEKNRALLTDAIDTLTPKLQLTEKELRLAKNETETANKLVVSLKAELEQERVDAEQDRQELLKMLNKASTELTALKAEKRQVEERMLLQSRYSEDLVQTLSKEVIQTRQTAPRAGNGLAGNESLVDHMRGDAASSRQTALA